jgi:pyruvate/2-oxoglutarate dehydrogenase complex dihydrolipoamide acyltransferase (E2) component
MKASLTLSAIRGAALALAVAAGMSAQGAATTTQKTATAPAARKKAAAATTVLANGNVIGLLDQAYGLLSSADHDYKGHRMHAMRCIKAAARELGVTLSGEGKGGGSQESSDSQLRSAQSLLQQAVTGLAGKPLRHEHKITGWL